MDKFIQAKKKRLSFHVMRELYTLQDLIKVLPKNNVFKLLSNGNFSSIAFIKFIAEHTHIKTLTVSTLRVGKKHLAVLDEIHKQGKLDKINFIVGSIMKDGSTKDKEYKYFDILTDTCNRNNWNVAVFDNHSKVLIFDTNAGYFVIETSSNLNENPNMEQFSFEQSKELYFMYYEAFEELGVIDNE